jgi:hypothetical protein
MDAVSAEPQSISPAIGAAPATAQLPRPSWDIAAIASLACGVMLIVPYLAGTAAVALGVMALRQTADAAARGRRLALAGVALGLLNIVGWTIYFYLVAHLSATGRAIATNFIADLRAARTDDAQRWCQPAIQRDRLEAASQQVMSWGGGKWGKPRISVLYIKEESANDSTSGSIRGDIQTETGTHVFEIETVNDQVSNFKLH